MSNFDHMERNFKIGMGLFAALFVALLAFGGYSAAQGPEKAEQSAREYMEAMFPGVKYRLLCRSFGSDIRCDARTEGDKPQTIALSCRYIGGCIEARGVFQGGQQ